MFIFKFKPMNNILIDCSNLKVGGGIQVATSFLND